MVKLAIENCLWEFGILAWGWEMWMLFCKKIINECFWYRNIETVVKNYLIQFWVVGCLKIYIATSVKLSVIILY